MRRGRWRRGASAPVYAGNPTRLPLSRERRTAAGEQSVSQTGQEPCKPAETPSPRIPFLPSPAPGDPLRAVSSGSSAHPPSQIPRRASRPACRSISGDELEDLTPYLGGGGLGPPAALFDRHLQEPGSWHVAVAPVVPRMHDTPYRPRHDPPPTWGRTNAEPQPQLAVARADLFCTIGRGRATRRWACSPGVERLRALQREGEAVHENLSQA
jgi:hypothetical protein